MDYVKKIICPMDGYTEKLVHMVEIRDESGKLKGYLSNGCDDMQGGEVCRQCRADAAKQFTETFKD